MNEQFIKDFTESYQFKGEEIILGKAKLNNEVVTEAKVSIPLKMMTRHGLIAGATGTGKTKSLQILAENLSKKGVPSLLMDIKGDLSGLAAAGASNDKIDARHTILDLPYNAQAFPVELLSISKEKGVKLRATVTEFGPILLSKILNLSETQTGVMSLVFKYCDDNNLALVDLKDIRKVLQYLGEEEGKQAIKKEYGTVSSQSIGTILRNIVTLEQQGADSFFGEPSFEVEDLLQKVDGLGMINIIRLTDVQDKPALFSTFMLSLLSEVYQTFPEEGEVDKPKLCIFIDEAHLIFQEASKELLQQIESVIKLIRSKGVGIYFITQVPGDIPDGVLSQLGLKIQHALRGFTAKDRKEIVKAVENYPTTEYYNAEELITQLGIGEAFVTALNEKGIPTPLAHTYMVAPESRMDILTDAEIDAVNDSSDLVKKYNIEVDNETAYELLSKKMEQLATSEEKTEVKTTTKKVKEEPSTLDTIVKSSMFKTFSNSLIRLVTREIMGTLTKKR